MTDDQEPADIPTSDPFTGLPQPGRTRFQPLRMGLIDIWQYSEQEFRFHDGRLILKGRNGSGKTKVLEVTSPFLFDANLTAQRLDPFGSKARPMRENLLHGGRSAQIGYVWCEYGRQIGDDAEFVTIGAGMKAWETQKGPPESWYFITSQRIGADFQLYDSQRVHHSVGTLAQVLGAEAVFTQAESYKQQVADRLFGISSQRLRSLVDLLLVLRRPKLSENLDVERLADILSDGLPPIDADLINTAAQGFDDLYVDREQLVRLENARRSVERFLSAYRAYATTMARHLASRVVAASKQHRSVVDSRRTAQSDVAEAVTSLEEISGKIASVKSRQLQLTEHSKVLHSRPEVGEIFDLERLSQMIETQRSAVNTATGRAADAKNRLTKALDALHGAEQAMASRLGASTDLSQRTGELADRCGLSAERIELWPRWLSEVDATFRAVEAAIALRRSASRKARHLFNACEEQRRAHERLEGQHDDIATLRDEVRGEVESLQTSVDDEVRILTEAVLAWVEQCQACVVEDDALNEMLDAIANFGDESRQPLTDLVNAQLSNAVTHLAVEHAATALRQKELNEAHDAALRERDHVAASPYPERPAPPTPRRRPHEDLGGDNGAPLWKLIDFGGQLMEEQRDGVEAALLGAGLLDAWVTPDGRLLDADTWDTVILPGSARESTRTVAEVLTAVGGFGVSEAAVAVVLHSIGFADSNEPSPEQPWVSAHGSWRLGPLHGQTGGHRASYIGPHAREQARERRLVEIDEQITQLMSAMSDTAEMLQHWEELRERLRQEQASRPNDERLRAAIAQLEIGAEQLRKREAAVTEARTKLHAAAEGLRLKRSDHERFAREHSLPVRADEMDQLDDRLNELGTAVAQLALSAAEHQRDRRGIEEAEKRIVDLREDVTSRSDEAQEAADQLLTSETAHATLEASLGSSAKDLLSEIERAGRDLKKTSNLFEQLTETEKKVIGDREAANARISALAGELSRTESDLAEATTSFQHAWDRGVVRLAEVGELFAGVTIESAQQAVALARKVDRRFSQETDEAERNSARNSVDEQFRLLQLDLSDPMWSPWGTNDGELFLVRVTYGESDHEVPDLLELLTNEINTRKTYINEEEHKLFNEVLLGSVGEHLRSRRREAIRLKDRINTQLEKHPTASKVRMQLEWKPVGGADTEIAKAMELLDDGATTFLNDEGRAVLVRFFSAQIEAVRENQRGDWRRELADALDYRTWCRFELQVSTEERPKPAKLTDGLHRKGSGGEKAIQLQLPLFAAAAAHYAGAATWAPRPVYLDEAFAGVDSEMRASCMGLLTELDLDFVMASHDESGFHKTVPGVATYHLYREPTVEGVLTTPIFWDGFTKHEREDPALEPPIAPTLEWESDE